VELKETTNKDALPSFEQICIDIEECVDGVHGDGTLKAKVASDLTQYIISDPEVVNLLERYKLHEKKLFILTNSHYPYTKLLMDHAINPYLKEHKSWSELFDYVITGAGKPKFFYDKLPFQIVDPVKGATTPHEGPLTPGIYEGGCSAIFTKGLNVDGEDILYIGDHIYGDILRVKKSVYWRTALVVDELSAEITKLKTAKDIDKKITEYMAQKKILEEAVVDILTKHKDFGAPVDETELHKDQKKISEIDREIGALITRREEMFNRYWGETMRSGAEESYFAYQVERFACIYMSQLKSLLECSPRTYFRAFKRTLPHEVFES